MLTTQSAIRAKAQNKARQAGALALAALALAVSGCEVPPADSDQTGYRGLGMVEVDNRWTMRRKVNAVQVPEPQPPVPSGTPPASSLYANVQVLGDLGIADFTRLMAAMTEWVSPDEGCNYCHVPGDLASDDIYTKVVSRRMIEMTQHINENWADHVGATGVTCWTCHQGEPVPSEVWHESAGFPRAAGLTANSAGQNIAAAPAGLTSMHYDPFSPFLVEESDIRVQPTAALPRGPGRSIQDTEETYALMMHMSEALGVACTYCHNSQTFQDWEGATPERMTAWHGIRLARQLNNDFLTPLTDQLPPERLGPLGDVPKVNCATCHQGLSKPLGGISMLGDYPELASAGSP